MKFFTLLVLQFLFTIMFSMSANGQTENKKITLDDIFKNRVFSSRGAGMIFPMNSGTHYCQLKTTV
jgi:hypothetical protein